MANSSEPEENETICAKKARGRERSEQMIAASTRGKKIGRNEQQNRKNEDLIVEEWIQVGLRGEGREFAVLLGGHSTGGLWVVQSSTQEADGTHDVE